MNRRFSISTLVMCFLALALITASAFAFVPNRSASAVQTLGFFQEATLASANVVTADESSGNFTGWAPADLIAFRIDCTEDSGTATLDVALQRSVDGGTGWTSIVSMTQLSATGSETKLYADLRAASPQMIGNRLKVNYDITGTGQYTCSVYLTGEG